MVFRRPYGFLIKHFRLIHLIITAILVGLVSSSRKIYMFLNACIEDAVNRYNALNYINYSIYIYIVLGIGLFFIIYMLFKYKDKPRNIYIISIVGYLLVAVFLFILFNYFGGLPSNVLNQKTIRMYRDIMMITLGFQYLIIVMMFIRGLGFDIKRFNFGKDIQELNLSSEDAEEVEVDVTIDTTDVMRKVRKKRRELGYFFQEYKVFILGIFFIIFGIVGFKFYSYLRDEFKVFHQGDVVGLSNYITVKNSYYNIDADKNYVIVKFDIFRNGKKEQLNTGNMTLMVGKDKYLPDKNVCYLFNKLGNCYKKQFITNENTSYVLVYKVDSLNVDKSYLVYQESYDDSFKVKLNLENYG